MLPFLRLHALAATRGDGLRQTCLLNRRPVHHHYPVFWDVDRYRARIRIRVVHKIPDTIAPELLPVAVEYLRPIAGFTVCGNTVVPHVIAGPVARDDQHGRIFFTLERKPTVLWVLQPKKLGVWIGQLAICLADLYQASEHGL